MPETEIVFGSRSALSPMNVSSFSMLSIPAFARAVDFLSSNLASFPIALYQNELESDAPNPLTKLFTRRANPVQTSHSFFRQWFLDGEVRGNGYAYIRRPNAASSEIIGLYNLLPDDVTPFRLIPEDASLFDALVYYWHAPSKAAFPAADIIHYRPGLSYDGLVGYSPQQLFAGTFQRAQALQLYQTKYIVKSTMIKASIEMPIGTTKEQAAEIVANVKKFRAETGDRDLIVLTGGATMKSQGADAQQAMLVEQDEAVTKKISQITGLDPIFMFEMAEQRLNAASVEAAGSNLVRFTMRTRLENIEDELSTKLISEEDQDNGFTIRLDTSALLRGDSAVEMTVATTGANQGITTPNEARAEVGLQPIESPENDKLRVPTHLVANPSDTEAETHAVTQPTDHYAAFKAPIEAVIERVESKASKALETAAKKPDAERLIYCNVLADQQASYFATEIGPIAETIQQITGKKIDIAGIGERYAAEIRRRAAGQEPKELSIIVGEANAA